MKLSQTISLFVLLVGSSIVTTTLAAESSLRNSERQLKDQKKDEKAGDKDKKAGDKDKKAGDKDKITGDKDKKTDTGSESELPPQDYRTNPDAFQAGHPDLSENFPCIAFDYVKHIKDAETCYSSCASKNVGCCRVANGAVCDEDNAVSAQCICNDWTEILADSNNIEDIDVPITEEDRTNPVDTVADDGGTVNIGETVDAFRAGHPDLSENFPCIAFDYVKHIKDAETCYSSCASKNVGCCRVANGAVCDEDNAISAQCICNDWTEMFVPP
jgi:hypothetical protein